MAMALLKLADAKAENDALRDDVAAGRHVGCNTSKQSVSQWSHQLASGVDNAASPDWQTPLTGLFHPQREADYYANNWKEPEVY